MKLTPEEMLSNYQILVSYIEDSFSGERKEKLLKLYSDWADRIATAPASSKEAYHNAFPGGYVLHVLNVLKASSEIYRAWENMGAELDFTNEELLFSAINHDLGKIGDEAHDMYIPSEEAWMIKKGQPYMLNPELVYMKVADRSLMILANRGIAMTQKEYLAIKLHDGLYEEGNKSYYVAYSPDFELKSSLPLVLHQADLLASRVERYSKPKPVEKKKSIEALEIKKPVSKKGALGKFLNE